LNVKDIKFEVFGKKTKIKWIHRRRVIEADSDWESSSGLPSRDERWNEEAHQGITSITSQGVPTAETIAPIRALEPV
jgi:hypothetical protein